MTYKEMFEAVSNGESWCISLATKSVKIGEQTCILNGVRSEPQPFEITIELVEEAFALYKHSIPNKNEPSRPYFKALKYDELSDEDKTFGESRDLARFRLEYLVLEAIMQGVITIDDNQWYWQSKKHKDFIILRSWIENIEPL